MSGFSGIAIDEVSGDAETGELREAAHSRKRSGPASGLSSIQPFPKAGLSLSGSSGSCASRERRTWLCSHAQIPAFGSLKS